MPRSLVLTVRFVLFTALVGALVLGLTGCPSKNVRPGGGEAAAVPVHTVTDRLVYVAIDAELTRLCPIEPSRGLAEAPAVAAARAKALADCNAQLEEIARIQGTDVHPPTEKKP